MSWSRFPKAIQQHITTTGRTLTSQWGDVEWGDMDEQGAAAWRSAQAAAGLPQGGVYASLSRLGSVVAACGPCKLWSAHYGRGAHICNQLQCRRDAPNLPADFDWSLIVGTQWTDMGGNGAYDVTLMRL